METPIPFATPLVGRSRTPLDILVIACAVVSLLSEWTIAIKPAQLAQTFGIETPACWLAVIGLVAALVLEVRFAVVAVFLTELVLLGWFGWALWVITTPRFSHIGFPFTPTDLMGPGWYAAAGGLMFAAGTLIRELRNRHARPRADLWLLTALPGFGLLRLGRWFQGGMWTGLFIGAVYFASSDSPDSTEFADLGRYGAVPAPYPRGAEWVLLAMALLFWVASAAVTVWQRRKLQRVLDSD